MAANHTQAELPKSERPRCSPGWDSRSPCNALPTTLVPEELTYFTADLTKRTGNCLTQSLSENANYFSEVCLQERDQNGPHPVATLTRGQDPNRHLWVTIVWQQIQCHLCSMRIAPEKASHRMVPLLEAEPVSPSGKARMARGWSILGRRRSSSAGLPRTVASCAQRKMPR